MKRTKLSLLAAICASLLLGCSVGPPSVINHKPPPSASVVSSQDGAGSREDQIDDLIRKGDEAYDNDNFAVAKSYYYQAMIAQSNPTPYVLATYALTLSQLGNFDNAQEIFKMAEAKYPNNDVIRKGIAMSNRILEEHMEQQRQLELARQQQLEMERERKKQEYQETANKMREFGNALQDLSNAINAYQGGHQKSQSSSNATSYSGSQSNNSSKASSSKNNYNCASASKRYSSARSSAESACNRYIDDNSSNAGYAKADCNRLISNAESIKSEAARNGCRL